MGKNWQSIRSKETVEKIKANALKKEIKTQKMLSEMFSTFKIERLDQSDYRTFRDRKPDISVSIDDKVIFYIEVSASNKYSYKPSKNKRLKLSKVVHVETEKVECFVKGYKGLDVIYAYLFADNYIKFCKFSDMKFKGEEKVRSFGRDEYSSNYIINAADMCDISIVKVNGKYMVAFHK